MFPKIADGLSGGNIKILTCAVNRVDTVQNTVKVLRNARAFIRIITFHGDGDGRLLEARVLTNKT